jgi:hypothetical protein
MPIAAVEARITVGHEMALETGSLNFVFPAVLPKMMYDDEVGRGRTERVVLDLGRARGVIRRYVAEMYAGVEYERQIYQPWNCSCPNVLEQRNVDNANRIGARLSSAKVAPVLGQTIPRLTDVPVDADLFETDRHDRAASVALAYLDDCPGLEASTASKLLHQKRPSFFPIFDTYARQAQTIPWGRTYGPSSYLPLLHRAREIYFIERNREAIDALVAWLTVEPSGSGIRLPRVRIIDILAWGYSRSTPLL